MERMSWTDKSITFRNLVDNPAIQKPALVKIGTKLVIVGERINGQFMMASPCKVSGDRFNVKEQEIVLSSKHPGVWRVISRSTSKKEGHIHRLSTKDLERIHKQDIKNERTIPRSYICTKDIEAFELLVRSNDPSIDNGQRIDKQIKTIKEDVEFEITDVGEVEYTPSEGERTSQDYITRPKSKSDLFIQMFVPGIAQQEKLLRNRVLRSLYCTTKNETHRRRFTLEVTDKACDIRPVASEGSTELRYLHSTQNLFGYMATHGINTVLYVKLLRGDSPIKAIEFDGYMVLKSTLTGDRIPICHVDDLDVALVPPNLPVRVRLPIGDNTWRSLSEVRAAELQCMQLSLALLSRHESETYVTIETENNTSNYLQSSYNQEKQANISRQSSNTVKKHLEECEQIFNDPRTKSKVPNDLRSVQSRTIMNDDKKIVRQQSSNYQESPKVTRTLLTSSHSTLDKPSRDNGKRSLEDKYKIELQRLNKSNPSGQTTVSNKPTFSSSQSVSANNHRIK